ncbi:hypothetical protein [Rhodovulum sulfidophilum]|uniref:hypothetical protein n=1 Tax=Rhodovulum sulfidophilum TaxID=35806 RepID=UPI001389F28D|nr:hypothetical protein [Rhodovulum sulfidophilum]NDK37085.1 hypothetical protein [Rhodovulum sulfidophilum]
MAGEITLSNTAILMDLSITSGAVDIRVEDVPLFDPAAPISASQTLDTQFSINQAFHPGENTMTFRVRFTPSSDPVVNPSLNVAIGAYTGASWPSIGESRPLVSDFKIRPASTPDGGHLLEVKEHHSEQEALRAGELVHISGDGTPASWNTYRLIFKVDLPLPEFAWQQGQSLSATPDTEQSLAAEYQRLFHVLAQKDRELYRQALWPFLRNMAAAQGLDTESYAAMSLDPVLGPESDYDPVPYSAAGSHVELFGEGRLAALVPIPLKFRHREWDDEATLFIYFWKDQTGQWQIIH